MQVVAQKCDGPQHVRGGPVAMPSRLTDFELETCARALRALAFQEGSSAEKVSDPALRAPVQQRAKCAAALAERFEAARRKTRA